MSAPDPGSGSNAKTTVFSVKPNYANVTALAPMVRCGTQPLRLMCLKYGADLTWSEELIAFKLAKCSRHVDDATDTVSFRCKADGTSDLVNVYVTDPTERGRNIIQLGAPTGPIALEAANVVARDVCGLDVNMGCPKRFSLQGGMGAELLKDTERAADIVRSLARNLGSQVGITCKIRLLPTLSETCDFVRAMVSAGADAVTVHVRRASERPVDFAHWDVISTLQDACTVPLIINGDAFTVADVAQLRALNSKSGSVMLARGALANPSLFQAVKGGELLPTPPLVSEYLALAMRLHNPLPNTKFTVQSMVKEAGMFSDDAMFRAKSFDDLSLWLDDWMGRYAAGELTVNSRLRSAFSVGQSALFADGAVAVTSASAGTTMPIIPTSGVKRGACSISTVALASPSEAIGGGAGLSATEESTDGRAAKRSRIEIKAEDG